MKQSVNEKSTKPINLRLIEPTSKNALATIFVNDSVYYGVYNKFEQVLKRMIFKTQEEARSHLDTGFSRLMSDDLGQIVDADVWIEALQFKTQISISQLYVTGIDSPKDDAKTYADEWSKL
jgi:hypothetical protein